MAFTRGQRTRLSDLGVQGQLRLELGVRPADRFEVVVAGLGSDDRLVDTTFLLSRHQPESFEGSVHLTGGGSHGVHELRCDLDRIPPSVTTLRLVLVGLERWSADSLDEAWLRVAPPGVKPVRWAFSGEAMAGERAIIVADLYRRVDWRIVLLASGYRAGLADFLSRVGGPKRLPGSSTLRPPPPQPTPPPPPPRPAPSSSARPATTPGVRPVPASPAPPPPRPERPQAGRTSPVPAAPRDRPSTHPRPGLTWRERLVSPPVARAAGSPAALGLGATGAVGGAVVAGLAFGSAGAVAAGAAVAGVIGWGGKVARKVPKRTAGDRIDPFSLREPWRHFVRDALEAQARFAHQVERTRPGPVRDRLGEMAIRFQVGVEECWRIARHGGSLVEARLAIDDAAIRHELRAAEGETTRVLEPGSPQVSVINALRSQLDTAARLDRIIDETYDKLRLLDARLDATVARAIELSVAAAGIGAVDGLGDEVEDLITELELLRSALEDMSPRAG